MYACKVHMISCFVWVPDVKMPLKEDLGPKGSARSGLNQIVQSINNTINN